MDPLPFEWPSLHSLGSHARSIAVSRHMGSFGAPAIVGGFLPYRLMLASSGPAFSAMLPFRSLLPQLRSLSSSPLIPPFLLSSVFNASRHHQEGRPISSGSLTSTPAWSAQLMLSSALGCSLSIHCHPNCWKYRQYASCLPHNPPPPNLRHSVMTPAHRRG